jgi:hypothetical protein
MLVIIGIVVLPGFSASVIVVISSTRVAIVATVCSVSSDIVDCLRFGLNSFDIISLDIEMPYTHYKKSISILYWMMKSSNINTKYGYAILALFLCINKRFIS